MLNDDNERRLVRDGDFQFLDRSCVHILGTCRDDYGFRNDFQGPRRVSFSFQRVRLQVVVQRRSCYSIVEGGMLEGADARWADASML